MNNVITYSASGSHEKKNYEENTLNDVYFFLNATNFVLNIALIHDNFGLITSVYHNSYC